MKRDIICYFIIFAKKIILTTDQDLIKDGVQAIDDEFLEWFVKNSSCIVVKVIKNWNYPLDKRWKYKIIIPKEELSKDEIDKFFIDMVLNPKEEPKQETLVQLNNNKMEITIEEIEKCMILNEYDEYRKTKYKPVSLVKFLIDKLIESRKELTLNK